VYMRLIENTYVLAKLKVYFMYYIWEVFFTMSNFYLRYDTRHARHARIFIFMRDTRIKKIMIRDTRHESLFFFMRDKIIKKIMIRDTRHATRVFI